MFRASEKLGNSFADAAKKGSFKIEMGELSIKWQLPLDSVVNHGN